MTGAWDHNKLRQSLKAYQNAVSVQSKNFSWESIFVFVYGFLVIFGFLPHLSSLVFISIELEGLFNNCCFVKYGNYLMFDDAYRRKMKGWSPILTCILIVLL